MEMVAIMATIILIATLATLIFAFAAYFITKAKRKKIKPVKSEDITEVQTRRYFERYFPNGESILGKEPIKQVGIENEQWT